MPGDAEFSPNEHGEEPAESEQRKRHDEVLDADHLVVGRVLPVLPLALALAGHVLGIVVGDVMAEHPADRAGERANADHEADDPGHVRCSDERIEADL